MIHRGSRFSHMRLPYLAFRHGGLLPACTQRVSVSFSTFRGLCTSRSRYHGKYITPISHRSYADTPKSRPKAHTGRTTTALSKKDANVTTIITDTNSKGGKNPAAKLKAKPKKGPNSKSKAKTKSRSNAKAKPGSKKRPTKVLTARQKQALAAKKAKQKARLEKAKQKEKLRREKLQKEKQMEKLPEAKVRKAKALALQPPKPGARSVWQLVLGDTVKSETALTSDLKFVKDASAQYRHLTPERREVTL